MSDEDKPAYDIEAYRHGIEEARRTHDQQLDAFNDIGEKAWRLVRLNGLIATIFVAAVVNPLSQTHFSAKSLVLLIIGVALIGMSIVLAISGQREQSVPLGQSPESLESLRNHDPSEIDYLYNTIDSYEDWISTVNERTRRNAKAVTCSKYALLAGVGFMVVGTLDTLVG